MIKLLFKNIVNYIIIPFIGGVIIVFLTGLVILVLFIILFGILG